MPPKEFSPEITEDFYNRLAGRIGKRTDQNVGLARSEALAAGRQDDPYADISVGYQRAAGNENLADLDADMAYRLAGLGREERLTKEGQQFQAGESEKDRGFRERMAKQYQDYMSGQADTDYRRQYQSALWMTGGKLASKAIGYGMGGGGAGVF